MLRSAHREAVLVFLISLCTSHWILRVAVRCSLFPVSTVAAVASCLCAFVQRRERHGSKVVKRQMLSEVLQPALTQFFFDFLWRVWLALCDLHRPIRLLGRPF